MNPTNPKVDEFIHEAQQWQAEFKQLRRLTLECGLTEELKWRLPCYTYQDSNIVIIQGFKGYCALMYFNGALLKDASGILVKPGKHTQAGRQVRFTNVQGIVEIEPVLKAYIHEAVAAEKAGLKVEFKGTTEYVVPEEFQRKLDEDPALKTAFEGLTPGRQRAYLLYFSQAKQSQTRASRVEKCIPQILAGKGLSD